VCVRECASESVCVRERERVKEVRKKDVKADSNLLEKRLCVCERERESDKESVRACRRACVSVCVYVKFVMSDSNALEKGMRVVSCVCASERERESVCVRLRERVCMFVCM